MYNNLLESIQVDDLGSMESPSKSEDFTWLDNELVMAGETPIVSGRLGTAERLAGASEYAFGVDCCRHNKCNLGAFYCGNLRYSKKMINSLDQENVMNKYNEQAIRNFVSGKGSVMTEEGKRKAQKEFSNKISVWWVLLFFFALTVTNAIQWRDINVRIIFVIQIVAIIIWFVVSKLFFGLKNNLQAPINKLLQISTAILFLVIVDLTFIGGFRILYTDFNVAIPSTILLLQCCGAAVYERRVILIAIKKNDGIMKKPFENMKDLSQGGIYVIVMIVTMIALRGYLNLFTLYIVISATFITMVFSRTIMHQIYKLYFTNKYDLRDELFKNVL